MASKDVKAGAAYVELFAKDSKLVKGLNKASREIKRWADNAKKRIDAVGKTVLGAGKWIAGLGTMITAPLAAMTTGFAAAGDNLDKMSQRTGVSTEALSELGYAAELCGSDLNTLEVGIKGLDKLLLEAAGGSAGAQKTFERLGLSWQGLRRMSPEKQFLAIVGQLKNVRSSGDRAAIAMKLFGDAGMKLLPMVEAGTASIEEMREEARKLGVSMSGEDAAAAASLTDAMTRLWKLIKGVSNAIGAALAPEITDLTNRVVRIASVAVDWIKDNRELIVTIAKWAAVMAAAGAGLMALGTTIMGVGAMVGTIGSIVGTVLAAASSAIVMIGTVIGLLMTPIGAVVAGIAALAAYFLYASGMIGDSVDWIKDKFFSLVGTATKTWSGIVDAIRAGRLDLAFAVAWAGIRLVWTQGINFLYDKWLWIQNILLTTWNATIYKISSVLIEAWAGLQATWADSVFLMQKIFAGFSKGVVDAWKTAERYVAKGIAWIIAKISGLDAAEMVRIVDEGYDQQQKERNDKNDAFLKQAAANWKGSREKIDQERVGTLKALEEDYGNKQDARRSAYDRELAGMEQDRLAAEKQLNDAIAEASKARFENDVESEKKAMRGLAEARMTATREVKSSSSGTFSAFAAQSLQSQGPMDRVAVATESTAKSSKKMADKIDKQVARAG